jgi:phosphoadenosine phosphosulfate reductase
VKIPYLGKIKLFWCDHCQVPLIYNECGLCTRQGRKISLSPPGDVRPALQGDLKRLLSVVKSQFGEKSTNKFRGLIENQVILLNKVPYIDKMDEIIIQGKIVGVFRYNIIKEKYELLPRVSLAAEIWNHDSLGYVNIDIGARMPIIKGGSVLSPGVLSSNSKISLDDPVIIVCENEILGVGLAKMTGNQMGPKNKGVAVKTKYRRRKKEVPIERCSNSWDKIIEANLHSLNTLEKEAIDFIEEVAKQYKNNVVAFSGGKDSLVTLDLVAQSDVEYNIIFSNTRLEYDETLKNIQLIGQRYRRKVHIHENDKWDFWERFNQFGPPSRNSRWCCKSAKLSPVNELLDKLYPEEKEVLSFIGRRRYESFGRSKEKRVSQNPWIPKQVTAAPISNWNAFEVFLYIHKHNLTQLLNPLYDLGFVRVGCWLCPASSMSDLNIMEKSHPSLLKLLYSRLEEFRKKHELPIQYITWGLWRWKYLPKKVVDLLKSKQLDYKTPKQIHQESSELVFRITSNPSPCIHGGFSAMLSADQILDLSRIAHLLPIMGSIKYVEDLDILSISTKNHGQIDIYRDGSIVIKSNNLKLLNKHISNLIRTIYRITYCDGCGVCIHQCSNSALVINTGFVKVIVDKCSSCIKCNEYCPLLKYHDSDSYLISENLVE